MIVRFLIPAIVTEKFREQFSLSLYGILYFFVFCFSLSSDLKHNDSKPIPNTIDGIPCFCDPGLGKPKNTSSECKKCPKGSFSHGGELIDDWSLWNSSSSGAVLGHAYRADSYCSDFLTGKSCNSWRPSGMLPEYLFDLI